MQRTQAEEFKASLIGEYEDLADYYRAMASAIRQKIKDSWTDDHTLLKQELDWHEFNAQDFQARVDLLKGDNDNGSKRSVLSANVSTRLSRENKIERIDCTTVL